ncbi:hypothetical protein [Tellurirhabdus bombi]|uniref:hypothetical protein n=1 Tax=Tellurirhabdus bombi TaxID=2907205 RepID=UPI001F31469E|nr:hypothetical protein [Tellurirhabdus bombi]
MKFKFYLLVTSLFVSTLVGCSKKDDSVSPNNTAELLARKWEFVEFKVKTDAKTYTIPSKDAPVFGDDNVLTINKNNTYTVLDYGQVVTGKWELFNNDKTLTFIAEDDDSDRMTFTINSISKTDIDLSSLNVDVAKVNMSSEEYNAAALSALTLLSIDKDYGGTVDFSKEPKYKTLQMLFKAKAL